MPTKEELAEMDSYLDDQGGRLSHLTQRGQKAMCHGMCLDWIRRILGGKKTRFDEYEGDDGILDREKASLGTVGWMSNLVGLTETSREKRLRRMREIHDLREITISQTMGILEQEVNALFAQAKDTDKLSTQQLDELQKKLVSKVKTLNSMMEFGASHPTFWKNFGELWNSRQAGRSQKDANFLNISGALVGTYVPVFAFGSSAEAMWASEIRRNVNEVTIGNCATLLLGGSNCDHAVAIHRVHAQSVEFFDPNFGELVFSLNVFPETMAHLVAKIYKGYSSICRIEFQRRQI